QEKESHRREKNHKNRLDLSRNQLTERDDYCAQLLVGVRVLLLQIGRERVNHFLRLGERNAGLEPAKRMKPMQVTPRLHSARGVQGDVEVHVAGRSKMEVFRQYTDDRPLRAIECQRLAEYVAASAKLTLPEAVGQNYVTRGRCEVFARQEHAAK